SGNVVLSPGVYYVSGGNFSVTANANVSGSGVTIYLAAGAQVLMRGNASVNMAAPTSGTYSGILFFGARNGSGDNTFNGDASSHLTGDLYFPSENVSYLGNFSGTNGCSAQGMTAIPARQAIKIVE